MTQAYFEYPVLICDDFESLLASRGTETSYETLLSDALRNGRVLLQAPGGSGKSYTLNRLADYALRERNCPVVFILVEELIAANTSVAVRESLRAAMAPLRSYCDAGQACLMLLDGLNEVGASLAEALLQEVNLLAVENPSLGVVVTDRLARRNIEANRWALRTLGQVDRGQVRKLLGNLVPGNPRLSDSLGLPSYLAMALRTGEPGLSRAEAHESLLVSLGLSADDLDLLSSHAYSTYSNAPVRLFSMDAFRSAVGEAVYDATIGGGLIAQTSFDSGRYEHHLTHDFLASRHVAMHTELWGFDALDVLSFGHNSYDSIALLVDQSADADVDSLITLIYDWDIYGAAYVLAAEVPNRTRSFAVLGTQILAMLGDRRFDIFADSVMRAEDALRVNGGSLARKLLSCDSTQELIEVVVRAAQQDGWATSDEPSSFSTWLSVFSGLTSESQMLAAMCADDRVMAWTATNVLRRGLRSARTIGVLLSYLERDEAVVRWRASHALGATQVTPFKVATAQLLTLAADSDLNVRYGALRGAMEIAARFPQVRKRVISRLSAVSSDIVHNARLADGVDRSLRLRGIAARSNWDEDVASLLERLLMDSDRAADQDRWRYVARAVKVAAGH